MDKSPGQLMYELAYKGKPPIAWERLTEERQAEFEGAALAALDL